MNVLLSPIGNGFQFLTTTGLPLNGGYLYTYQAGSSTPIPSYLDSSGNIANSNPIVLGTDGRPPFEIWFTGGTAYKMILTNSAGVVIATYDNLYGIPNSSVVSNPIPSGSIIMWSGSIGAIPAGYVICDGTNSTPNLQDRFIIGAGGTYAVGDTGGFTNNTTVTSAGTYAPKYYALAFIMKT